VRVCFGANLLVVPISFSECRPPPVPTWHPILLEETSLCSFLSISQIPR